MGNRFGFCMTGDHEKCPAQIDVVIQEGKGGGTPYRLHFGCDCDCHGKEEA